MQNKALRPNVIPSTAIAAAGTLTSQVESSVWGRGIRIFVTVSAVTAAGGTDSLYLCGVPPNFPAIAPALQPPSANAIALTGFAAANMLSVVGTYCFDFYPGAWLPTGGLAASGQLVGVAGINLPTNWAVRIVMGTGNAATVVVGAEILP
jgi:hypothetical protein